MTFEPLFSLQNTTLKLNYMSSALLKLQLHSNFSCKPINNKHNIFALLCIPFIFSSLHLLSVDLLALLFNFLAIPIQTMAIAPLYHFMKKMEQEGRQ
jgi:hypothetical protein